MFKSASISKKQGELLNRLVHYFDCNLILELGTHLGLSGSYLMTNSEASLITLEGCPNTAEIAKKSFSSQQIDNLDIIVGAFSETLPAVLAGISQLDFVYIDGNHSYDGTLWNFEKILPLCSDKSIVVFDDINWSTDMQKAWQEIISSPNVSLSINCYKFGIVFFQKGIEKQNFYFKF